MSPQVNWLYKIKLGLPGWVFFEQTRILGGIQFTTLFIDFWLWKRNDSSVVPRDRDAANLRPALKQGYKKQTPSAGKLLSRANLLYAPYVKM